VRGQVGVADSYQKNKEKKGAKQRDPVKGNEPRCKKTEKRKGRKGL